MALSRSPGHVRMLGSAGLALSVLSFVALAGCSANETPPHASEPEISALEREVGARWNVVTDPRDGSLAYAEPRDPGPILVSEGTSASEAALGFIVAHRDAFLLASPGTELVREAEGVDGLGLRWASLTQAPSDGVVAPYRITFHFDAQGRLAFLSARYAASAAASRSSSTRSTQSALRVAHARRGRCQGIDATGHGQHFYAAPPLERADDVQHFEVSAATGGGYVMQRTASDEGPAVTCTIALTGEVVASSRRDAWDESGDDRGAAVDAYVNVSRALTFYRTALGRKSYDDHDAPVSVGVHLDHAGAFYADGALAFGAPDRSRPSPALSYAGAFDAVAHELQHGVTASTLRLQDGIDVDGSVSGILDESISDIFGAFAEHSVNPGDHNFTIGEDVAAAGYPPTRDLAHPSRCLDVGCVDDCGHRACPDHLSKLDPLADVHRSAGISSNAWYLMTAGGSNDTSGIRVKQGLGWETSLRLWYALVVSRAVAPSARFEDVALATVGLARHAGGGPLDVDAVACSWVAVGVLSAERAAAFWNVRCGGGG
jgi:Zn-dependent metalloprotease